VNLGTYSVVENGRLLADEDKMKSDKLKKKGGHDHKTPERPAIANSTRVAP
jgi:hypothetical protein